MQVKDTIIVYYAKRTFFKVFFLLNLVPHIGHLYSTVLADTIRRNYLLHGKEVLMSTGTDEHGLKVRFEEKKARQFIIQPLIHKKDSTSSRKE